MEERVVSESGGTKGRKLARFDLIPADPLWEVARLYGEGAKKYDERNWERGYKWSLSFAALMRHAWQFWRGESYDEETGCHHLTSVVFHAFALMQFEKRNPEYDDRPMEVGEGELACGWCGGNHSSRWCLTMQPGDSNANQRQVPT